jgi:hypothetical protein
LELLDARDAPCSSTEGGKVRIAAAVTLLAVTAASAGLIGAITLSAATVWFPLYRCTSALDILHVACFTLPVAHGVATIAVDTSIPLALRVSAAFFRAGTV